MKIGFDSKRLFCNFTGLGNYSRTMLKNLAEFHPDNNYHLYTPKIKNSPDTDFFLDNNDYNIHLPSGVLKSVWRSYSIVNQLKRDNLDIYHGLSHELPINIHKTGIKSIVSIHDLIFKIYPNTFPTLDRNIYDFKFKYSCNHSDRIVAISNSTKNDIVNLYDIDPNKIDVVYQCINPLYYTPTEKSDNEKIISEYKIPKDYLLSVGSVEERKNLKTLIEAYQHLPSDYKLPLVIVGRGKKYKEEVMELIKSYGLEKLVHWLFVKDNHHLHAVYQEAKALIYPSVYEGFGLPVVESLLSKTPVITSNVSSLPEAGGPSSLYIDPKSPEQLASAIEKVIGDERLAKKMIDDGFKYANDNFSAQTVTNQMIEIYNKTLNS